jgi:hypothetical protein
MISPQMRDLDDLFAALARPTFRRRFKLRPAERTVLATKGLPTVLIHARDIIAQRLAPATIPNDGKQTPFKGHPVFIAQHATATCCRGCLSKWHGIEKGRALTNEELDHVVRVIERWLVAQHVANEGAPTSEPVQEPSLWDRPVDE